MRHSLAIAAVVGALCAAATAQTKGPFVSDKVALKLHAECEAHDRQFEKRSYERIVKPDEYFGYTRTPTRSSLDPDLRRHFAFDHWIGQPFCRSLTSC